MTETKTTPMHKLACALVALVMAIGICVPTAAFAAEAGTYTITVNPAYSGETYTAYKVFDATYNDSGNVSYTIDSTSPWFDQVAASSNLADPGVANPVFTLTQVGTSTTYVVEVASSDITGEQIAAVLTPVPVGAAVAATATPTFEDNADGSSGSGSVTLDVSESEAGYYFVTTSLGSVVSIDTTHPSVTVGDKNPVPTLTKEVKDTDNTDDGTIEDNNGETDGTEDNAKVGDILEFEIDIYNAAHKSSLCLHDYVNGGLTFQGEGTIHVYLNSNYENKVDSANYNIKTGCSDGCIFEIEFDPDWLDTLSDTDVINVTYEATVDESAVVQNYNDAYLTYGIGGRSVTTETETDVFGFDLVKTDSSGVQIDGATFTLSYSNGTLIDFVKSGTTYTVHDAIDEKYASEETTNDIVVGSASIFGLEAGTYILTETAAPDGYNMLTSSITITISDDGTVSITGDGGTYTPNDNTITVVNNAGQVLPGTGGMGTTIFYIIGGILVVGAVVLLITRRRMNNRA